MSLFFYEQTFDYININYIFEVLNEQKNMKDPCQFGFTMKPNIVIQHLFCLKKVYAKSL